MKKLSVLLSLLTVFILTGCTATKPQDISILDCIGNADQAGCVVGNVNGIKDEFVRKCVEGNISSKTGLYLALQSGTVTPGDIKDIDSVTRECISYKITNPTATPSSTPVFNSFLSSLGGSFLGSYLANSFMGGGRYNYNSPIDSRSYNTYQQNYREEEKRRGGGVVPNTAAAATMMRNNTTSTKSLSETYSASKSANISKGSLGGSAKSRSTTTSVSSQG